MSRGGGDFLEKDGEQPQLSLAEPLSGLFLTAFVCYPILYEKTELAKARVAFCFRNTSLESTHTGIAPVSNTGDCSDVFILDANGNKIPWGKASRISQAEMAELMRTAVDRVYAVLSHEGDSEFEEQFLNNALKFTRKWDEPSVALYPDTVPR